MSFLFGGPTTSSSSSNAPWSAQQPFLTQGFQDASNIYNARQQQGPYTGPLYSSMTPAQLQAAKQGANWATGAGQDITDQTAQTAAGLQGAASPFMANAQNLATNPIAQANPALMGTLGNMASGQGLAQGPSSALSMSLNNNAVNAAQGAAGFQNQLSNAVARAAQDPTQQIGADANAYANNSYVQQSVNSVNRQIGQTLNEQTLPGINRAAAMGGALNSSRAGAANAQAQQGAAIAEGNADASLYNNAYNQGLNTSANQWATGLGNEISGSNAGFNSASNAALGVGGLQQGLSEFNTGAQLQAANSGLQNQLGFANSNVAQQLGANSQLGQAASQGLVGALDAGAAANQAYQLGQSATSVPWQNRNLNNQAGFQDWNYQTGYPQSVLQGYMSDITGNYGSQGSSTSQTNPSLGSSLLGGAMALGGSGALGSFGSSVLPAAGSALMGSAGATASAGAGALGSAIGASTGGSGILGALGSIGSILGLPFGV